MLFFSQQQSVKKIQQELKNEQEKALKLEQKFDLSKEEFRKNKEELERKRTELQEFRELNKKKLKRLKESELSMNQDSEANMSDRILDETNKTVLALEAMIESLKNDTNPFWPILLSALRPKTLGRDDALSTAWNDVCRKLYPRARL